MEQMEKLTNAGINAEVALQRFSGNQGLYFRFLSKFLQDDSFAQIGPALEKTDYDAAFRAAHTLKGVSGNLGMDLIYEDCSALVEALRKGQLESTGALYTALADAYSAGCKAIQDVLRETP